MADFFPEDGYDPDSGEYESPYDFEPVFTARVQIAPNVWATIETTNPDFSPLAESISSRLEELVLSGSFDIEGNRNPNDYKTTPPDFDIQDKNIRGPFIDTESVERFLQESGLRGIAIPYYDEANDEYWIDVNTS